jgi:hypothetical protein
MSGNKLQIEICSDSGCGLIVADVNNHQLRVSMLPDEVLEAKKLLINSSNESFVEYIEDINPKFERAIVELGVEPVIELFLKKTKHLKN